MKYKGILLDIDNTLYDYNTTHNIAKENVLDYCNSQFNLSKHEVAEAYDIARKKVHIALSETAASHNRLLYFQKMLELLNINPLNNSLGVYNVYWDSFLDAMQPFEGIYSLLEAYKSRICLVTDLTAHIQYRKIKKLSLDLYCNKLVTSEEVGREKPHPIMFETALQKLKLVPNEVCMIGDSFKKDILGATQLKINTIWLNHESKKETFNNELIKEVTCFKEILELI